ncbi:MAG: hypothetical protein WCJ60_01435 [bacterium]
MTYPKDDSFSEYLPDNFNRLRPRDTAYPKVAEIYKYIADKVAAYEFGPGVPDILSAEVCDKDGELEFDDEVWGEYTPVEQGGRIPRNEVILECIDSIISIRGLYKTKANKSDADHDLLIVTFLTDASELIPSDGLVINEGEIPKGFGEIVFGREMTPVLVSDDKSEHNIFKGGFNADAWGKAEKTEITDRDAIRIVAILTQMRNDVTGYDRSTWPKTK